MTPRQTKAKPIDELVDHLSQHGSQNLDADLDEKTPSLTAHEWNALSNDEQQTHLLHYRMTYLAESEVSQLVSTTWDCPGQ